MTARHTEAQRRRWSDPAARERQAAAMRASNRRRSDRLWQAPLIEIEEGDARHVIDNELEALR